jgi:hypothetical protein
MLLRPAEIAGQQRCEAQARGRQLVKSRCQRDNGSTSMTQWTGEQLDNVARAEEVQIASVQRDGALGRRVTIWIARNGDDLYVRSVRGRNAHWFGGTQERHEGRIWAGSIQQDVTFVDAAHDIDDEVDAAYQAKYRRYAGSILDSVLTPEARSTTIKLVPR